MSTLHKQKLFRRERIEESVAIMVGFSILIKILTFGKGILFARLLGPINYGIFTMAFFYIYLVAPFTDLNIPSCYNRYVPQYEKRGMLRNFFLKTYFLSIIMGIVASFLFVLFSGQISKLAYGTSDFQGLIILASLTILPLILYKHLYFSFSGLRIFKMSSLLDFTHVILYAFMGIVLVVYRTRAESAILGNLIGLILAVVLFGLIFWKYVTNYSTQNKRIEEENFYAKIFKFSIWFAVMPIIYILFSYTDRWMLNRFMGLTEVGIYSVCINITGIFYMLGAIIGRVLAPNLSHQWEDTSQRTRVISALNFATRITILFLLGGSVLFVLLKKYILLLLYGEKYIGVAPIIGTCLIFQLIHIAWVIMSIYPTLIEKTSLLFIVALVGLTANIALNYTLIPLYGLEGAASATAIAYVIALLFIFILNSREKMYIELKTILVSLSPLILTLGNQAMVLSYLTLFLIAIKTELFFKKEEKEMVFKKIRRFT